MIKVIGAYKVEVIQEQGYRRMVVENVDGGPVVMDVRTLQSMKDECLGKDVCAVEVFPSKPVFQSGSSERRHYWEVDPKKVPSLSPVKRNPCIDWW